MGLLERLQAEKRSTSTLGNPSQWLIEALGANPSATGVSVTPTSARGLSAAFACMNVLAQDVGSLPCKVYERLETGRRPAFDHPLWRVVHDRPNPYMTAFTFRQVLQWHLTGWGNAFAEIEWDAGMRRVLGLWPLLPDRTCVEWRDGQKFYRTRIWDNGRDREVYLHPERVLHVLGPSFDGLIGLSTVTDARHAIGAGLAAQEYGARFFSNGAHLGLVGYHPSAISAEARDKLRAGLEIYTKGLKEAHRIAILEEGVKLERLGIEPEKAQLLELRQFTVEDIARYFRMPPHKIQHLLRSTFSNIEHQAIEYLQDTLRPLIVNHEQAMNSALFHPEEQGRFYVKFNVASVLRGDQKSMNEAVQVAILGGWMSPNEARELNEMNPLPPEKGDVYILPTNYTRSELLGAAPAQQLLPAGEPQDAPAAEVDDEEAKSAAALRGACQRVLEAALARVVRRECRAIRKLAQDWIDGRLERESFLISACAELTDLEPVLRSELGVVVAAFGGEVLPAGVESAFARETIEEDARQLREASESGAAAVVERLESWETTKGPVLARLMIESGQERGRA